MGGERSPIRHAAAAQSLRPAQALRPILRSAQSHGLSLGPTLIEQQRASVDLQQCETAVWRDSRGETAEPTLLEQQHTSVDLERPKALSIGSFATAAAAIAVASRTATPNLERPKALSIGSFATAAAAIAVTSRTATPKPTPPPAASEAPIPYLIPYRPSPVAAPPSPPPRARAAPCDPAPDGRFTQGSDMTHAADEWLADYDQVTTSAPFSRCSVLSVRSVGCGAPDPSPNTRRRTRRSRTRRRRHGA